MRNGKTPLGVPRIGPGTVLHKLEISVFVCGMSTMMLELVGSRLLAPYLGTSIFVWTSLIGVILGALSFGYWLGGRVADRKPDVRVFSAIIFAAALFVAGIALLGDLVLVAVESSVSDLRLGAVMATFILFGAPSVLLGMVSPYAVRLKVESFDRTGRTVGNLYALSTLGSILGTFLAGFILISHFSSPVILFFISMMLTTASLAVCAGRRRGLKIFLAAFFALGAVTAEGFGQMIRGGDFFDVNTPYNRVWIYNGFDVDTGLAVRVMQVNDESSSRMLLGSEDLADNYAKFFRLGAHFNPGLKKALMIGGAAYSYPKDYLLRYPDAAMDAVEIDPKLTALAKRHFRLTENPRLKVVHEDARTFLNKTKERYDVIYGDAFKSLTIPFQLATRQAAQKMYDALNDNGVLLMNVISSLEGEKGMFLRAEAATLKSVFPQVYLFPVENADDGALVQNVMLVALRSKERPKFYSGDSGLNQSLQHIWFKEIPADLPVLTDGYAPVDTYMLKVVSGLDRRGTNPVKKRIKELLIRIRGLVKFPSKR